MSKLTILGIVAAATVGTVHGLLGALYRLTVDQDTDTNPKGRAR